MVYFDMAGWPSWASMLQIIFTSHSSQLMELPTVSHLAICSVKLWWLQDRYSWGVRKLVAAESTPSLVWFLS